MNSIRHAYSNELLKISDENNNHLTNYSYKKMGGFQNGNILSKQIALLGMDDAHSRR
jgi:hypothetical protein